MIYLQEKQLTLTMAKMFPVNIGKFRIRRLLAVGCVFVLIIFYLFSTQFNVQEVQFVQGSFIHRNFNKVTEKITNWLEGQVLGISYEERFCRHVKKWNKTSKYPPVKIVAQQLNLKDGDSVFLNGLHCGEWVVALKGTFPNIKLYGVDKDADSITYVSSLVNGTYKVSAPFELSESNFDDKLHFDHAIVDGVLSIYSPDLQCKTVKQMIPMLKAGGSLYIGKNFEQCDDNKEVEKHIQKYLHVQVLQKCFWSQNCLFERPDVVEILYSKERNIMHEDSLKTTSATPSEIEKTKGELIIDFSSCATSVFIHKHIVLASGKEKKKHLLPDSKYEAQKHEHTCTVSESVNATKNKLNIDKEGIKKAVMDMKIKGLDMH